MKLIVACTIVCILQRQFSKNVLENVLDLPKFLASNDLDASKPQSEVRVGLASYF